MNLCRSRRKPSLVDAEARHGAPEVPPPRGQHARPHHLTGLEARKDGVQEVVRQGAQLVHRLLAAAAAAMLA